MGQHRLWGVQGHSCSSRALVCRLSPFGIWVQLLRSIWNILRPGIEPMSLTLADGFFLPVDHQGKPLVTMSFNSPLTVTISWTIFSFFFFMMILMVLMNSGQVLYRMSFKVGLSDVFSHG